MTSTPNLDITLVSASQNQKEVTVNEALVIIDGILNNPVLDKDLTAAPGSPASGDLYIVGTGATGTWASKDGKLAYYYGGWKYITPNEGFCIYVADEDIVYVYSGSAWKKAGIGLAQAMLDNKGNNAQYYINKNAAGDSASVLFQTNYVTHAEFGCIGDDDFQLKVSANGSDFTAAWKINKTTGNTQLLTQIQFPTATELTIASGAVTATLSNHKIDTEADGATDDLDTISGLADWAMIILTAENTARTVVIKHNTGNIITKSGSDVSLDDTNDIFMGIYNPIISKVVEL